MEETERQAVEDFFHTICDAALALDVDSEQFYRIVVNAAASKPSSRKLDSSQKKKRYVIKEDVKNSPFNGQKLYGVFECTNDSCSETNTVAECPTFMLTKSGPTYSSHYSACYNFLQENDKATASELVERLREEGILNMAQLKYAHFTGDDTQNIPWWLVLAQDLTGDMYDEQLFVKLSKEVDQMLNGYGTHLPATHFNNVLAAGFYWPKTVPIPPLGNANLQGIISGQVRDPGTPYKWTQQMKLAYPSATMISSQYDTHGIRNAIDADNPNQNTCLAIISEYLMTGVIPNDAVDGTICPAPLPDDIADNGIWE